MQKQLDAYSEETDLGTFLGDIANKLTKEGDSLRALAVAWFESNTDEQAVLVEFGVEMGKLGRQLLALRGQLCNDCQTKILAEVLSFGKFPERDNGQNHQ